MIIFSPTLRVFLESKWKWFLFPGGRIIKYPPKMSGGSSFSGFRDHASSLLIELSTIES